MNDIEKKLHGIRSELREMGKVLKSKGTEYQKDRYETALRELSCLNKDIAINLDNESIDEDRVTEELIIAVTEASQDSPRPLTELIEEAKELKEEFIEREDKQ